MIDRSKYGLPPGSNLFQMASIENKILARCLAENENLYTSDIMLGILRMYEKEAGKIQIQHITDVIRDLGLARDRKKLEKRKMGVYNRNCLTMDGIMDMLRYFKEKKFIRDYKEEDISKNIQTIISELYP